MHFALPQSALGLLALADVLQRNDLAIAAPYRLAKDTHPAVASIGHYKLGVAVIGHTIQATTLHRLAQLGPALRSEILLHFGVSDRPACRR